MVKNHLTRLTAPKSWPIKRKGIKFITKPSAGAYTLEECITLNLVLNGLLKYAKTSREVKKILNGSKIMINGVVRKDPAFALGILDIVEIPELKENYLVIKDEKGKFGLIKINNVQTKVYKIKAKTILKKSKVQLNLYGGSNLLIDKDEYKVGDSIIVNLKDNKILNHLRFEKGSRVYIEKGNKVGMVGKVLEIKKLAEGKSNIVFEVEGKKLETSKNYAFVIGDLKLKNE
ncbi:MAG: 30S ribosomal protein S4e [archaeon]